MAFLALFGSCYPKSGCYSPLSMGIGVESKPEIRPDMVRTNFFLGDLARVRVAASDFYFFVFIHLVTSEKSA